MAFSNKKLEFSDDVLSFLNPIVFKNVRSTEKRKSKRLRECYATGDSIREGEEYINHQFRYDGRIITISLSLNFFYFFDIG